MKIKEAQEQNGGRFINVAWDYITRAVNIFPTPELWFEPEEPILTKQDFTKELLIWGEKKKRRIEFLHEGIGRSTSCFAVFCEWNLWI